MHFRLHFPMLRWQQTTKEPTVSETLQESRYGRAQWKAQTDSNNVYARNPLLFGESHSQRPLRMKQVKDKGSESWTANTLPKCEAFWHVGMYESMRGVWPCLCRIFLNDLALVHAPDEINIHLAWWSLSTWMQTLVRLVHVCSNYVQIMFKYVRSFRGHSKPMPEDWQGGVKTKRLQDLWGV